MFDDSGLNMSLVGVQIEEADGSPTGFASKIKFPNGSLTDNGDGSWTFVVSGSVVDHGTLAGLSDDDHTQYHNDARASTWLGTESIATIGTKDHDLLGGLTDDDHTIYVLLAGRSGGQTIIGGIGSGDGLTLQSTSHATKGTISLENILYVDCVNSRVGIGAASPARPLSIIGNVLTPLLQLKETSGDTNSDVCMSFNRDNSNTTGWSIGSTATFLSNNAFVISADGDGVRFDVKFIIKTSGEVGIGTSIVPDRLLHVEELDATTNAVTYSQRLTHTCSNVVTDGFGVGMEFELENASGTNVISALVEALWDDSTNGSEKGRLVLKAKDSGAEREVIRIEGSGSEGELGFFATAAAVQQSHIADADGTIEDITTKFNTLLGYLETYGLLKTS